MPWEKEGVPDTDVLYMRVHQNDLDENGWPKPGAFKNRPPEGKPLTDGDGMSTDWSRYSNAFQTLMRARNPQLNSVIRLPVGEVRAIPQQVVEHSPIEPTDENPIGNRAHTDVKGNKKTNAEVRVKFRKICWVIPPEEIANSASGD